MEFPTMQVMRFLALAVLLFALATPAQAASMLKSYSYFSIGGRTLEELEKELSRRGPQMKSTGKRHPGATQMEFTSKVGYAEQNGTCRVAKVGVTVRAKVILPRWKLRRRAEQDVALIWDTLSADIKRHEESHVIIAKNHARELENAIAALRRFKTCADAQAKVKSVTEEVLAAHDRAQDRFDKIEGINFESRIMRLLKVRMERM